jgi:uncharacterized YccA/Bax inhibitor family protein
MANPFRTTNPVLTDKAFRDVVATGEAMTLQGTVNKTGLLLFLAIITAAWTWGMAHSESPEAAIPWMWGGLLGGLGVGLVTTFKPQWSALTAPLYALLEGLALGGISAFYDHMYPGLPVQAIGLTFSVLLVMLLAYKTGAIRATQGLKMGVLAATGGIALLYMTEIFMGAFFHLSVPAINGSGTIGIGFSIVVVCVASLNLVLNFDRIETAVSNGAPKYMEWYGAFGMMVTLVWLYLEMLRLLSKLRRR